MSLLEKQPHASEPSVDFLRKPAFLPNSLCEEGAICSVLPALGGLQLSEVRAWVVPCRNSGRTITTLLAKAVLPGPTDIPAVALQVPKRDGFFFPPSIPTLFPKQELLAVHLPAQQKFQAANGDRGEL